MFLNDWLRSWHDRVFGSDKENNGTSEDDDWDVFEDESETVSKDVERDGLKNVLLLTGPVGVCVNMLKELNGIILSLLWIII